MAFIQNTVNFIFHLWHGQISLAFTYWIIGFAGNFAVLVVPLLTVDTLHVPMTPGNWVHLSVSAAYFVFSSVCIARAIDEHSKT